MKPELSIVMLTHNRVNVLCNNLMLLENNTKCSNEIIVVNNGSNDGTAEMVRDLFPNVILVDLKTNIGHSERNYGYNLAKADFIGQVDDDVSVAFAWDQTIFRYFEDDVAAVGPQGFIFQGWENPHLGRQVKAGEYADHLTGFTFITRNDPSIRYDEKFNPNWHEECQLSFQWRLKGYRLRVCRPCSIHSSLAGPVNWEVHDAHVELLREQFQYSDIKFEEFDQQAYLKTLETKGDQDGSQFSI